jgi:cobalt/nickel transport system permease protein
MFFAPIPGNIALTENPLLHIPDGFLSLVISAVCWLVTLAMLLLTVRRAREEFDERLAPLAGVMAAFIFAGQMINFPVAGGTSGHLIGATLAFVVLGPWLGLLAMTAVIALQAILFQDGGLVVMGANILVMGIVPGMVGYGVYQWARGKSQGMQTVIIGVGAWLSVVIAAFVTALLLSFSNTTTIGLALPAMVGIHMLIGVGEALITVAALSFIVQARPSLLQRDKVVRGSGWVIGGIGIALLVTLFSPLASAFPDGLEWVAGEKGFLNTAQDAPYQILPDYTLPFLGETAISTILAGIIGVLLVGAITALAARNIRRRSTLSELSN